MVKQRQGGLGRGLGALIPSDASPATEGPLRDVPVGDIAPNSFQPRRHFDEEAMVALADSIRELGVLQPILVRVVDDGFELIAGERRWRAAQRVGLDRIPAIVRNVDDETSLAHAIVENVQRAELNAIEEAAAFQQLIDEFDLTQDDVATRVGRSRPAVANALRLLQLPTDIQRMIIEGKLSAGHGRVLVPLDDHRRSQLLTQTLDEELSVRALERLARGESVPEPESAPEPPAGQDDDDSAIGQTKLPALLELEELLGERLDTKVGVSMTAKRGRITIDFADIDDLERIYALIANDTTS